MEIGLTQLGGGTPVFYVNDFSSSWGRVFGAVPHKASKKWYFPAFHPFLPRTMSDLKVVAPVAHYSQLARDWISSNEMCEKQPVHEFKGNFAHQNMGFDLLTKNYRFILNWEMGTGKSKVVIDVVNALKERTLVLCPLVGAENWAKEIRKHVGDQLSCLPLIHSRDYKLEQLKEAKDYDVVSVPFDTTRMYGVPTLQLPAQEALKLAPFPIPKADLDLVRQVNDYDTQVKFLQDIVKGRTRKDLRAEVTELSKNVQWLCQLPYSIIVADESHRIKHLQSARTKVCMQLASQAARRYLLTGTLSQGDPRDMYPQLKFLAPYLIPEDYQAFQKKYVSFSPWNKRVVTGFKNLHILNKVVEGISSVVKLKDCKDMPEQLFVPVVFDLYDEQVSDYNYAVKENGLPTDDFAFANGAVRIAKLLEICSGFYYSPPPKTVCDTCINVQDCVEANIQPGQPKCSRAKEFPKRTMRYGVNAKLDTLNDLLDDILEDPKHKVVIWAFFEAEMEDLRALLKRKKLKYICVDSSNSAKAVKLAEEFSTKDYSVYLSQIGMGISIDLVAAKYMVYYSRSWKLDDWDQSLRRSYRITQDDKTVVYNLIARNSVEENQMSTLNLRQDISKLLTEKANCLTCLRYEGCQKTSIKPWDVGCKMETSVLKGVTKPKEIKK